MDFGQKLEKSFLSSFLPEKGHMKVFSDLVDRKLAILDYKNMDLKKNLFCKLVDRKLAISDNIKKDLRNFKILHFSKGVSPWFLVKNWKSTLLCFEAK